MKYIRFKNDQLRLHDSPVSTSLGTGTGHSDVTHFTCPHRLDVAPTGLFTRRIQAPHNEIWGQVETTFKQI